MVLALTWTNTLLYASTCQEACCGSIPSSQCTLIFGDKYCDKNNNNSMSPTMLSTLVARGEGRKEGKREVEETKYSLIIHQSEEEKFQIEEISF